MNHTLVRDGKTGDAACVCTHEKFTFPTPTAPRIGRVVGFLFFTPPFSRVVSKKNKIMTRR